MDKKYVFTGLTKVVAGILFNQIQRVSDKTIGGWIEKESNLSHNGDAWVCDNAKVYGNAWVYGNTWVYDNARVCGNAKVYGNARVCGDALLKERKHCVTVTNLCFNVTVTPQNATIGCQTKTHNEWLNVKRKDAVLMGLPLKEFSFFKALLTILIKKVLR